MHRLIAGRGGVYICDECVDLCNEIIHEEAGQRVPPAPGGSGEEQRRSAVFSTYEIRRHIAVRDYGKAVTEAESLLEHVRELRDHTSPDPQRQSEPGSGYCPG